MAPQPSPIIRLAKLLLQFRPRAMQSRHRAPLPIQADAPSLGRTRPALPALAFAPSGNLRSRHADLRSGHWVLKPALGRVGESVAWCGAVPEKDWRSILRSARWFPSHWAAQRKFTSVPLPLAPGDDRHFCLGVYTVQGTAAGIYGRCSRGPVIDYRAQDVPVLLSQSQPKTRSPRILPELALS